MNTKPNIVYILADDLGYGDVSCLNPDGKIPTPHLDRLAAAGMLFTDAHATSSVCSPSRYSILTGRYNWRSPLQRGIVGVYGNPLIEAGRLTVPGFLQQNGYRTACIGKWHLGQGWDFENAENFLPDRTKDPSPNPTTAQQALWQEAFARPTIGGPTTRGFDLYFGVDVPNWPPYCYIENDRTLGIPSQFLPARLLGNNQGSLPGPAMADWNFEQLLPTFAEKASRFIAAEAKRNAPFFLYMPLTSPHTPLAVNAEWKGKSRLNLYADFVMETDAMVGLVLDALEANEVAGETIVLFASDNGCAHYIGVPELEAMGHFPSASYRGYKSDAWDGGHRIPCIARWPGAIEPGSTCGETVCLSDLMATCADILGLPLPDDAGEDSFSILPLLKGDHRAVRESVVHHSINGKFALRRGRWKLVLCTGSGGWTQPTDDTAGNQSLPDLQLYDMESDPGERTNLHATHPEVVDALVGLLSCLVANGRSTPGPIQSNDVAVDIWKKPDKTAACDA